VGCLCSFLSREPPRREAEPHGDMIADPGGRAGTEHVRDERRCGIWGASSADASGWCGGALWDRPPRDAPEIGAGTRYGRAGPPDRGGRVDESCGGCSGAARRRRRRHCIPGPRPTIQDKAMSNESTLRHTRSSIASDEDTSERFWPPSEGRSRNGGGPSRKHARRSP